MRLITSIPELRQAREEWRRGSVGLIPTMGYLHAGHLSHAHTARAENDIVVASVFVNPTQFGPHEDLDRYPRDLPSDTALLASANVDAIFAPTPTEIYPPNFATWVEPSGPLTEHLEGARRPGHFRGVATIVTKLLLLVEPQRVYFGQKDAQQVAVVRRLIADLNIPVELRVGSTVREADGLAMSSRNVYLKGPDRVAATILHRALLAGRDALEAALSDSATLPAAVATQEIEQRMAAVVASEPRATLDYAALCDPDTCAPLTTLQTPALLAIAARIGETRLIDNLLLRADGSWDLGVTREG